MIYPVYAMRDIKTNFLAPVTDGNDATALRNFAIALQNPQNVMHWAAEDYELYCIGTYNNDTGELVAESPIRLIARGSDIHVSDAV